MYERFTDRARKVLLLASQEAVRFNHEYVGTEHILLGLAKEGGGIASIVLKNLNADLRKLSLEVEKKVRCGETMVVGGKIPQTPKAKMVIAYAIEEARNFGNTYVGTEHILLGLLREVEGLAAITLRVHFNLEYNLVKTETLRLLREETEEKVVTEQEKCINAAMREGIFTEQDMTELYKKGFKSGYDAGVRDAKLL